TTSGKTEEALTSSYFDGLNAPAEERALVEGCRALTSADEQTALGHLRSSVHLADGAYLAGFVSLSLGLIPEAIAHLEEAARRAPELGQYFSRYEFMAAMSLPITPEIIAHVEPDLRGTLLGLVEAYQREQRWHDAILALRHLRELMPTDVVVSLSLAELLMEAFPDNPDACQEVLMASQGIENESALHAALLLYRGKAHVQLGEHEHALQAFERGLSVTDDRPPSLLETLGHERALLLQG
ncbi:MAG: DUF4236 domain-containing protein, partial [Bradymonadaceae bacterium]